MLNPAQRQGVTTMGKPVLLIAGPGTGKTQVLAARVGYILQETDTSPSEILCITYTDAGTIAMRNRLLSFIGPEAHNVAIHTFHSFCNSVIQENQAFFSDMKDLRPITDLESIELLQEIYDEIPATSLIKNVKAGASFELSRFKDLFDTLKKENLDQEALQKLVEQYFEMQETLGTYTYKRGNKNKGIKVGDIKEAALKKDQDKFQKTLEAAGLLEKYRQKMLAKGRYDYQDMLTWVLDLFQNNPEILAEYQEQFQHVLVDEFQDTSGIQSRLLFELMPPENQPDLFVVGDDDQSIFRFQGANLDNLRSMIHLYDPEIVVLTENYRSSPEILEAASSLMAFGKQRIINERSGLSKNLSAAGKHKALKNKVSIIHYDTLQHEHIGIVQTLEKIYNEDPEKLSKVAVLYNTHRQISDVVKLLQRRNIPYNLKRKTNLFDEPFFKSLVLLIRYIFEEYKDHQFAESTLYELLYMPWFGIDPVDVSKLIYAAYQQADRFEESRGSKLKMLLLSDERLAEVSVSDLNRVLDFRNNIEKLHSRIAVTTPQLFLEEALSSLGILQWSLMNGGQTSFYLQQINALFNFVKEQTADNPTMTWPDLLTMLDRMQEMHVRFPLTEIVSNKNGVQLMTTFSSKGLEFDEVIIMSAVKDYWEGGRGGGRGFAIPILDKDMEKTHKLEEKRRLFYVAMTRAERKLNVNVYRENDSGKAVNTSTFISEILDQYQAEEKYPSFSEEDVNKYMIDLFSANENPPFKLIDEHLIDRVLDRFVMNVTDLNTYLKCPTTFYYEKILRIPSARRANMGYGSAAHRALELFFTKAIEDGEWQDKDAYLQFFKESMEYYASHFTLTEKTAFIAHGEKELMSHYDASVAHWAAVPNYKLEHKIKDVHYRGVPLKGTLDKIELYDNDEVGLVDYKTSSPENTRKKLRKPTDKIPKGEDYWRQLVFYHILIQQDPKTQWHVRKAVMDCLSPDKMDQYALETVAISKDDIDFVGNQIEEVYEKIKNHEFQNGCQEPTCYYCQFVKNNHENELIAPE